MSARLTAARATLIGFSILTVTLWAEIPARAAGEKGAVEKSTPTSPKSEKSKKKRASKKKKRPPERPELTVPKPYRGTVIGYRNVVSVRSFRKDRDLTYSPYYAMELTFTPTFWAGPHTYLALDVAISHLFTHSYDVFAYETTPRGETVLWDIFLEVGVPRLLKIPVANVDVRPTFRFVLPTSKGARARTMILGMQPGLKFIKYFKVFHRLALFYGFWFRKDFHVYTTSETMTPLIGDPIGSARSLDSFMNIGIRNVSLGLSNQLGMKLAFVKRIGMELRVYFVHQFLYDLEHGGERVSYEPQESAEVRYLMRYTGELYYIPRKVKSFTVALGFLTENPQLRRDSSYETPFFNRYTALYLDLRLNIAGLSSQIASKRGRK